MRSHPYRWLNVLGLIAVLVVNTLANTLPIAGKTTGELSDQYPVLITPAGYVFSIWSLIYVLLIGFIIYQAMPRTMNRDSVQRVGIWFLLTCLFNCTWIIVWHYELLPVSVGVMLALLLSLIVLYTRIRTSSEPKTLGERIFVYLPFSIYMGWISVATIVNITVLLYDAGWEGFGLGDTTWTVILIVIAVALAAIIGYRFTDAAFMLVFVWALIGIGVKQQGANETVALTAYSAAGVVALLLLGLLFFRRRVQ
ncbi:tryptophan-rich sensory protein [Paenibacillus daejeonensis]|uniref:tryptophan-rich sensory protein n=1 Tax=Paenibacillus daejeonensis TaxID=135193 RepID=UPI0003A4E38D|nr:tryptophan-rich sensory protein [Paenibacillus daejeonensis]